MCVCTQIMLNYTLKPESFTLYEKNIFPKAFDKVKVRCNS